MHILETIKQEKIREVEERKSLFPVKLLEKSVFFESPCTSMKEYVGAPERSGIIAEFKRQSPSKGNINRYADVEQVSVGYMQAGASALSVLTDNKFFGGSSQDLITARKFNFCPILRKDFIIDEYQIVEAKSIGADVILLIARILTPEQIKKLTEVAHQLGMEVFLETHSEQEILDNLDAPVDLVGINNRNLDTFEVSVENSIRLAEMLPNERIKVAESGIDSIDTIRLLKQNGFKGFLIGEYFMKNSNPASTCRELIQSIKS
jgi:indole-3-glycerol phosphate synthase